MVTINQAMSAFTNFLDGTTAKYDVVNNAQGQQAIMLRLTLDSRLRHMTILITFETADDNSNACIRVVSYGIPEVTIDNSCKAQMLEYITRVNYEVNRGHLEMNVDGCRDIRYKVTHEVDNYAPGDYVIHRMISVPLLVFERYGDGMLAVSMGLLSAKEAFRQAESKQA